jgi:hypothetical protein
MDFTAANDQMASFTLSVWAQELLVMLGCNKSHA